MIITSTLAVKVNTNIKVFGGSLHGKEVPFSHDIQTSDWVKIDGEYYNVAVFQKKLSTTQKFTYTALIYTESDKNDFLNEISEDFERLIKQCTYNIRNIANSLNEK